LPLAEADAERREAVAAARRARDRRTCREGGAAVFHHAETLVIRVGAPFVPIEHEGVIYIRPPVG
jgi:hypothetical protein